ncbi:phage tail protein [Oceanimonas sp. AH20CE76]|uniref:phage tail-collar fiber domain-containing protein n=1 Tax=Oceanimonas sp. AH20CE76 TaxID=2977120 RepID=UPI0031FE6FC5
MSQTAITLAFEQHLAELQLGGQPVVPDEFVLAYLPGLDLNTPIDRAAGLPPAGQIVHRQPVDQRGKVNANGVAYSIIMDTRVGDFTFNAMYLVHKASGMVAMVVHKVDEDKLANQGHNQPGNSLVKSMLMEYQGAAEATNTHVDAGTWQIDFTARLMGLDADIRLQALDHYGKIAFIDSGFVVTPGQGGNEFLVAPGLGYIAGLRTELSSVQSVTVSQRPAVLYADVYHAGTLLSDWHTHVEIKASSTPLTDYTDEAGYPHYVVPLASLAANGTVSDLRGRGGLWWHEHRPDAHTKDQVGLSKLENWSWSHSYTDATGGASKYASGKAVADAYNALNSAKLDKTGTAANAAKLNGQLASYYLEWNNLTGKPATFPPSSHAHSWNSITGKPATFPPSGHNHDERYLGKTAKAADSARLNGAIDSENSTGSTIVKRSSSGDINARLFRSEYDTTNASVNFIMTQVDTAGNNYIRPTTPEQFRAGVTDSYYLGKTAKAADSDKLDGQHGSYYRAWGNITGKPATFPPSGHTHDDRYYTKSQSDGRYLGKTAKAADSDKLDGQHGSYYKQNDVYTGSNHANTSFPIGHILTAWVHTNYATDNLNKTCKLYLNTGNYGTYASDWYAGYRGAALPGTWVYRGYGGTPGGISGGIFQRIA